MTVEDRTDFLKLKKGFFVCMFGLSSDSKDVDLDHWIKIFDQFPLTFYSLLFYRSSSRCLCAMFGLTLRFRCNLIQFIDRRLFKQAKADFLTYLF